MSSARAIPARLASLGWGLLLPVIVAAIWQGAASSALIDPTQWASPVLVAQGFVTQAQDPQFWADFGSSLLRFASGTAIGVLLGLPVGLALGLSATLRGYLSPTLDATKAVPFFTWVPLIAVWVGSGEAGKITFIALASSLPVLFNSMEGAFSVPPAHRELGRFLRLGWFTTLRRIILPGAAPGILRGTHMALLYGWLATIGAEYLFEAGTGIGTNIMGAREMFQLDIVVVDMIAIGLVGIALDAVAGVGEQYVLRWQPRVDS